MFNGRPFKVYWHLFCLVHIAFGVSGVGETSLPSFRIEKRNDSRFSRSICPPGYYGPSCENKCKAVCASCDSKNFCVECASRGKKLPDCTRPCDKGLYGQHCDHNCSSACLDHNCEARSGYCYACRNVGVKLPTCTEGCSAGTYGKNCREQCPPPCRNTCDRFSGVCESCDVGKGIGCAVNCAAVENQRTCQQFCPSKCVGWCNTTDARCSLCVPGFKSPFCKEKCDDGTFGSQCNQQCSQRCKGQQCDHVTGDCRGCIDGYVGKHCNGKCVSGLHGPQCRLLCPETCVEKHCNAETGDCEKCLTGYSGPLCDRLCEGGTYGDNCSYACPLNCLWPCDPVTGDCQECLAGYQGAKCNLHCEEGHYGINCNKTCPIGCLDGICQPVNGDCLRCREFFHGPKCETFKPKKIRILKYIVYSVVSILAPVVLLGIVMAWYQQRRKTQRTTLIQSIFQTSSPTGKRSNIRMKKIPQPTKNDMRHLPESKKAHTVPRTLRQAKQVQGKYTAPKSATLSKPSGNTAITMATIEARTDSAVKRSKTFLPSLVEDPTVPLGSQSLVKTSQTSAQLYEAKSSTGNLSSRGPKGSEPSPGGGSETHLEKLTYKIDVYGSQPISPKFRQDVYEENSDRKLHKTSESETKTNIVKDSVTYSVNGADQIPNSLSPSDGELFEEKEKPTIHLTFAISQNPNYISSKTSISLSTSSCASSKIVHHAHEQLENTQESGVKPYEQNDYQLGSPINRVLYSPNVGNIGRSSSGHVFEIQPSGNSLEDPLPVPPGVASPRMVTSLPKQNLLSSLKFKFSDQIGTNNDKDTVTVKQNLYRDENSLPHEETQLQQTFPQGFLRCTQSSPLHTVSHHSRQLSSQIQSSPSQSRQSLSSTQPNTQPQDKLPSNSKQKGTPPSPPIRTSSLSQSTKSFAYSIQPHEQRSTAQGFLPMLQYTESESYRSLSQSQRAPWPSSLTNFGLSHTERPQSETELQRQRTTSSYYSLPQQHPSSANLPVFTKVTQPIDNLSDQAIRNVGADSPSSTFNGKKYAGAGVLSQDNMSYTGETELSNDGSGNESMLCHDATRSQATIRDQLERNDDRDSVTSVENIQSGSKKDVAEEANDSRRVLPFKSCDQCAIGAIHRDWRQKEIRPNTSTITDDSSAGPVSYPSDDGGQPTDSSDWRKQLKHTKDKSNGGQRSRSPSLIRCATTRRQASLEAKTEDVKAKPLPTPPIEGRAILRPVRKLYRK